MMTTDERHAERIARRNVARAAQPQEGYPLEMVIETDLVALRRAQLIASIYWDTEYDSAAKRLYSIAGRQLQTIINEREQALRKAQAR